MNQQNQERNEHVKLEKKHNYFYRITNQINWKYYFGIHSTYNLDDGYFGSGKVIKDAIKKHGKENFVKTIIADYPTRKEASDHEKLAVTTIQIEDEMCYNLMTGGMDGGFPNYDTRQKISKSKCGVLHPLFGKNMPETQRNKISLSLQGENCYMFGVEKSFEIKEKISLTLKEKYRTGEIINPNKDKPRTNECKTKISNTLLKVKCQIEGIEYKGLIIPAKLFNLTPEAISYRLKSKSDKWKDWILL